MDLKESASQQLRAEFPLVFDVKKTVSVRLAVIQKAMELLDRDRQTDPEGIAEMKRQLEDLRRSLSH